MEDPDLDINANSLQKKNNKQCQLKKNKWLKWQEKF